MAAEYICADLNSIASISPDLEQIGVNFIRKVRTWQSKETQFSGEKEIYTYQKTGEWLSNVGY